MNSHNKAIELKHRDLPVKVWEDSNRTPDSVSFDYDYGRRIESDRSWTVYHVFTGVVARIDGVTMTGMSCSDATGMMLSLNRRNVLFRRTRTLLRRAAPTPAGFANSSPAL